MAAKTRVDPAHVSGLSSSGQPESGARAGWQGVGRLLGVDGWQGDHIRILRASASAMSKPRLIDPLNPSLNSAELTMVLSVSGGGGEPRDPNLGRRLRGSGHRKHGFPSSWLFALTSPEGHELSGIGSAVDGLEGWWVGGEMMQMTEVGGAPPRKVACLSANLCQPALNSFNSGAVGEV